MSKQKTFWHKSLPECKWAQHETQGWSGLWIALPGVDQWAWRGSKSDFFG